MCVDACPVLCAAVVALPVEAGGIMARPKLIQQLAQRHLRSPETPPGKYGRQLNSSSGAEMQNRAHNMADRFL